MRLPITFLWVLVFIHCTIDVHGQQYSESKISRLLEQKVRESEIFSQAHTGFCLYDMASGKQIASYQADLPFVPASNVKLVTFYIFNHLNGNKAPAVFYQNFQGHVEAWGTGYPLTLHPNFKGYDLVTPWLKQLNKPVVINFPMEGDVSRYGPGWSWDDYNDAYVYERSVWPVYGNRLYLDVASPDSLGRQTLVGYPPVLANSLQQDNAQKQIIYRTEVGNHFTVGSDFYSSDQFPIERPIHISPFFITNELAAILPEYSVSGAIKDYPMPHQRSVMTVEIQDTVFRKFLANSDNFLAEQFLLMASSTRYGRPSTHSLLNYATDTLLPTIGVDKVRWVDGSGLSRYNLFTPRQITRIVTALNQEVGRSRLMDLLAVGGQSGTLKSYFEHEDGPYIYAKTGSLSGVLCLSGMMRSESGRWYAFSFMHNNIVGKTSDWYEEMENILEWCRSTL